MEIPKRPSDDESMAIVAKRQKTENELAVTATPKDQQIQQIVRTSDLLSPIMLLTGHKAEVYGCRFSGNGKWIASCSFDRMIYLWNVFGECENWLAYKGHAGAVLECNWSSDDSYIFSASTDKTVGAWDVEAKRRVRKYKQHSSFVNSVSSNRRGPHLIVSGSNDSSIKLWDLRAKLCVQTYENKYAVTSVCFSDPGDQIMSGSIDNNITVWELRKGVPSFKLEGHEDTITGMKLSHDGSYLLSNAMDNTVRIWDVKPFAKGNRCLKIFQGVQHNFEKTLLRCSWSHDGSKISAGSADRFVYVWETASRRILYKLPGHRGSVNDTDFHPTQPIIASGSSDGNIYLGEIKP